MKELATLILLLQGHFIFAQDWSFIQIDKNKKFTVQNQGKIYWSDFGAEYNDTIHADLIVNSDSMRDIRLAKATFNNDTLKILVYQTDPTYHHEYEILISKNRYRIAYRYLMSGDQWDEGNVSPIKTKLILNSLNFFKGQVLSGYTEFHGKYIDHEKSFEESILVKGFFSVVIR